MPISPDTLRAFLATDYRVRLTSGGCARIRIGAPLPAELLCLLRDETQPWGFVTAWNPAAQRLSPASNRLRQRELCDGLRASGFSFFPGVGVAIDENGWREPGLLVIGINFATLDGLAKRFGQAAVLRGIGRGAAELRVL